MKPIPPTTPVHTVAIDDVALAALRSRSDQASADRARCDLCDAPVDETPAASGLLLWTRGEEVRADEPPLCRACAAAIASVALASSTDDDDPAE